MKQLERDGVLNRELEGLPTSREVRRRLERGEGLTVPELSVLLAWTKIVLADELLDSDLPDDPYLDRRPAVVLPDADARGLRRSRSAPTRCGGRSS